MNIAWDLDGTLVFTREANWRAYRSFGIIPPVDFNTRPWQDWCSPRDHDRKGELISDYLTRYATATFLLEMYEIYGGPILTNASHQVVECLCELFPVLRNATIHKEMNPIAKVEWLASQPYAGVYYDDSERTIELVKWRTKWRGIHVRF